MNNSKNLLENFLKENNINIEISKYVSTLDWDYIINEKLKTSIFNSIIVDAYNGFSWIVKDISHTIQKKYGIYFGRKEKLIIKEYLDYWYRDNLDNLIFNNKKLEIDKLLEDYRVSNSHLIEECKKIYFQQLSEAINIGNKKRITDYINFLYSRVINLNEMKYRSVYDIYKENFKLLKKELNIDIINKFETECKQYQEKIEIKKSINLYNKIYRKIALNNWNTLNDVITININQNLFNFLWSKEKLINYWFELIKKAYNDIHNHRTLLIKIENIIFNHINIKRELYSYFTIYAENFLQYSEEGNYYIPEEICIDYLEHKYKIENWKKNRDALWKYYKGYINFSEITNLIWLEINQNEIDFFKYIQTGFQFIDCIILKSDKKFYNSEEVNFIKNQNEILLVFVKHEIDDRKIPCPVCWSLKVSWNSYTTIGIKSRECKNSLCMERSKTNRGKRYSARSNDMQNAVSEYSKENIIDKELISKRRKDIASEDAYSTLFEMIIKYYSFEWWNTLFINFNEKKINSWYKYWRNLKFISASEYINISSIDQNSFSNFINSEFIKKFVYQKTCKQETNKAIKIEYTEKYKIINWNCLSYLKNTENNSIDWMVTSPPYYNAREYSKRKNLYNYLNDMYEICLASYKTIQPWWVFFYNIWDIFDNPNTTVKSKMWEKRVALGAYLIFLFQKAWFELLDNIIRDKWETQSNRHKNDGNYTPYYQKPANCYEHMFIFKKTGKLKVSSNPKILNNIQKFSPVIKINNKWENLFGHTAPYPIDLPLLYIKTFTEEWDIIFDPFLWSWTTIYTAVNNGCIWVWTELDPNYYNLACSYIKKEIEGNNKQNLSNNSNRLIIEPLPL